MIRRIAIGLSLFVAGIAATLAIVRSTTGPEPESSPPAGGGAATPILAGSAASVTSASGRPDRSSSTVDDSPSPEVLDTFKDTLEEHATGLRVERSSDRSRREVPEFDLVNSDRWEAMIDRVGQVDAYAEHLETLSKEFPHADQAWQLRRVSMENSIWSAVDRWSGLLDRPTADLTPEAASRFNVDGDRLSASRPISPMVEAFFRLRAATLRIASRTDFSGQRTDDRLRRFLADTMMAQVDGIRTRDGRTYLLPRGSEVKAEGDRVVVSVIVGADGKTRRRRIGRDEVLKYDRPAVHCVLAGSMERRLAAAEHLTGPAWEPTFGLFLRGIAKADAAAPLPRLMLFERTLRLATEGSLPMAKAYARQLDHVRRHAFIDRTAAWFDPEDARGRTANVQAREFFDRMPPLPPSDRETQVDVADVAVETFPLTWVGYVHAVEPATARFADDLISPGEVLYIVAPDPDVRLDSPTAVSRREVGRVTAGQTVHWTSAGPGDLLLGRPLYIRSDLD